MSDTTMEPQEITPSRPRGWRYVRNLCLALVLTLAIFNATVAPPVRAEGTFEAPKIVVAVLIIAVALTSMLSPYRDMLTPGPGQRPAAHGWNALQATQITLAMHLIFATVAPILLMYQMRAKYAAAPLMLATAIVLTQPFSIPQSVTYSN